MGDTQKNVKAVAATKDAAGKPPSFRSLYSGNCPGGVVSSDVRCAVFKTPFSVAVIDMLDDYAKDVSTVLVKAVDYLAIPDLAAVDGLGFREVLVFKKELRALGDAFIRDKIGSAARKTAAAAKSASTVRFLAAHVRRNDFVRVRSQTTPELKDLATQLVEEARKKALTAIFV